MGWHCWLAVVAVADMVLHGTGEYNFNVRSLHSLQYYTACWRDDA